MTAHSVRCRFFFFYVRGATRFFFNCDEWGYDHIGLRRLQFFSIFYCALLAN